MNLFRNFWFALVLFLGCVTWGIGVTSVTLLQSNVQNLPIRIAGNHVLLGRFLVNNPTLTQFTIYITFSNGCRIQHFTASPAIPLQSVILRWVGAGGGDYIRYTRPNAGDNCPLLSWTIPVQTPYLAMYQFDILADWDSPGSLVALAGNYTATIDIITTP